MDRASFWGEIPILDAKMWSRIVNRIGKPTTLFVKRMGIEDCTSASIDSFFTVRGKSDGDSNSETLITWVPRNEFNVINLVKVYDDICENCLGNDIRVLQVEGTFICANCGMIASDCFESPASSTDTFGPSVTVASSSGDKQRRINQYIYKRCNHFKFWLAKFQAKESSSVKAGVIEAVRLELAKERIDWGDQRITYDKVRSCLKKLRLQKYYNNTWFITSQLSGRPAPQLTRLQEEKLLEMFHKIQEPFTTHCPKERVNMISYSYLLRKMCESLGWHELVPYFPLLKSRSKVSNQDMIWRKICVDIGIPFQKSIQ